MKSLFSPRDVFKTRNLVIMALMAALSTVLSMLEVRIDPSQKVYSFAYLPRAMAALAFGPWAAAAVAFVSDFTSTLVNGYDYFPGYALSAVAADVSCALFLYKRDVTFIRAALWRLFVIAAVVFGLNRIWNGMLYGYAGQYYTSFRLIRNLIQFPFDVYLVTTMSVYMKRFISGTWK